MLDDASLGSRLERQDVAKVSSRTVDLASQLCELKRFAGRFGGTSLMSRDVSYVRQAADSSAACQSTKRDITRGLMGGSESFVDRRHFG
jgi:hypothetical protein